MNRLRSGDAEIVYWVFGDGPPVVLLHPFPAHHELMVPAAQALAPRYKVILPDLRGHGESEAGEGPATMEKHAADLARVLDDADAGRAVFCGVSIGGYILFEFWRRYRGRMAGLVLCDTRAQADSAEGRAGRLKSAEDVVERGTEFFVDSMLPKLFGQTMFTARPDLVAQAKRMMCKMSPADIAQVQRGMAERQDSVPTLGTINVPVSLIFGSEDTLTPVSEGELMRSQIQASQLHVIAKAGHYAVWEQSAEIGTLIRQFADSLY